MVLRILVLVCCLQDLPGQHLNSPQGGCFALPPPRTVILLRIHPAQTYFVFINQCVLTAARLLDLMFLLSVWLCPLFFLSSNYLDTLLQKPFSGLLLPLGTAIGMYHCFSILMLMSSMACGQHPAPPLRNTCSMSPSGAGFNGGDPKEITSPSQAPHTPPALVTAGCLCKVIIHAC